MYNTLVMTNKLEFFKKKLLYRASYRGTKEMDILLSGFVKKIINKLDHSSLLELEKFLDFEDEVILNFYHHGIIKNFINRNKISILLKKYKI